jgi:hypothetical protein
MKSGKSAKKRVELSFVDLSGLRGVENAFTMKDTRNTKETSSPAELAAHPIQTITAEAGFGLRVVDAHSHSG